MADATRVAMGLGDLALKVKDKADQAESNQATCKVLAGHIKAVIPVIQDLEDKICEEDERLQDFVDDMGLLLVETDKLIDKITSRNMATKLLKASSDERELTAIEKRLAQMSQRATFQILTIVTEIKNMVSGDGATAKKKKDFREIELKLVSTQDVDRSLYPTPEPKDLMKGTADNSPYPTLESIALMRTTGEIVFVRRVEKEGDILLRLYTQQGESLYKKNIKWPCDGGHRFELQFLFVQILWREYLVISCMYCKEIKLLDMETLELTKAYRDAQLVGKMCKGWHKIYAKLLFGYVELDCSSTKLTRIRDIRPNEYTVPLTATDYKCYVPPPHAMIVGVTRTEVIYMIHATSLGDPNKPGWCLSNDEVNDKMLTPSGVVYSSRHDALLAVDQENKTVWVLHPSTGKVLKDIEINIDVTKSERPMNVFLRGSQPVIVSNAKIYNFSLA